MNKRHRGLHWARTTQTHNRLEKAFAQAWERENEEGVCKSVLLEYLLSPDNKKQDVSDRDCEVAATVIQWLGSPVGESFLSNLGFKREGKSRG